MRCDIFDFKEKSGFSEKFLRTGVTKLVRTDFGSCESMEKTSRGHRAFRKAEIEEADGSNSRKEGVGCVEGVTRKNARRSTDWKEVRNLIPETLGIW